ncbi:MAG: hypothetical protein GC180_04385 [Bacteroidetes bacterium]|nr:hypothetical protein [Bacteroidota bacterium]
MIKLVTWLRKRITNWKSNFLQFSSIFLAVYLGFVADNYRDDKLQKQAERQYIISMIKDVEADNKNAEVVIADFENRAEGLDTLLQSFHHCVNDSANIYFRTRKYLTSWEDYYPITGTIEQLRSGGFRLIRSHNALDNITGYYGKTDDLVAETNNLRRHFYNTWDAKSKLIDSYLIDSLIDEKQFAFEHRPLRNLFLTNDRAVLNQFFLGIRNVQGGLRYLAKQHKAHIDQGERLIAALKQEYDLHE